MRPLKKTLAVLLVLCMLMSASASVFALSFTDAHGNVIELDESLEAYSEVTLHGADNAARAGETNLGDLWADALRWFAVSGRINEYFDEDDITAGNNAVAADADHIVAIWNGGNLRDDIAVGKFGALELAEVLPYPNKVAVVYLTGAQLLELLEAASQGLPYSAESADACASFMQVSGLKYSVDIYKPYDAGEAYGRHWFRANSTSRVTISEVNGQPFDEAANYAVITSNANFNGMDASYVLKEAAAADEKSTITTAVVRDIVWMYIAEELQNVVGETYAAPQGRIGISGFADVPSDKYYFDPVMWAVDKDITGGCGNGLFNPDGACTRAQAITFLWKAAGSPAPAETENPFEDVAEDAYYRDAVLWAYENKVTSGTSAAKFSPDRVITRAQAVTFLYNSKGSPEVEPADTFSDVPSGAYYEKPVIWAVANKVTSGTSETTFSPDMDCTRAHIITFIFNCCK